MALTQPIYILLRKAWDANLLRRKGAMLEFGEANCTTPRYSSISINRSRSSIRRHAEQRHGRTYIGQFFKTMHECTKTGGLMLREAPFNGWVDHGFYTVQPTLFFDVAAANGYELLGLFYIDSVGHQIQQSRDRETVTAMMRSGAVTNNASLYAVQRKHKLERPFVYPFQGYYAGTLTAEQKTAWQDCGEPPEESRPSSQRCGLARGCMRSAVTFRSAVPSA